MRAVRSIIFATFFFLKNTRKYEYNINIVAYDGSPYKTKYFQITVHTTRKLQEFKIIICKEIMNAFVSKRLILIFEGIEAKFYKD